MTPIQRQTITAEVLSEPADDSSEADAVKSEDDSPPNESARSSPPPNCAICLGKSKNKSFTDSCLHQFCFKCLLTWSRVKTECPLCKQNFKSIIHNVRSNHQYEEYPVPQAAHPTERPSIFDFGEIINGSTFRFRTTLTMPRRETLAIREMLLQFPMVRAVSEPRREPAAFRRTVYRHNLWARPLPDFTGRFRDCSPNFYRHNNSQLHRLVPWLNRDLFYLLNENTAHMAYVQSRILELLPRHAILSTEFREEMQRYLADRTDHFVHELHVFASTPYDLAGYDRHVQYHTGPNPTPAPGPAPVPAPAPAPAPPVSQVLSSSDSESADSDIVMVTSSRAATPPPRAARRPAPRAALVTVPHSDTDTDSEVMVVGYMKPPSQRTPETVDLLASDSDVMVHEDEPTPAPAPAPDSLVRFELSVRREPAAAPPTRRRRARRTASDASYTPPASSESSDDSADASSRSAPGSGPGADERRAHRNKAKRRRTRKERSAARSMRRRDGVDETTNKKKKSKGKAKNGKNVKSTDRTRTPSTSEASSTSTDGHSPSEESDGTSSRSYRRRPKREPGAERALRVDTKGRSIKNADRGVTTSVGEFAGTSGVATRSRPAPDASGAGGSLRARKRDRNSGSGLSEESCDNKRLKSVVVAKREADACSAEAGQRRDRSASAGAR